MSAGQTQVSAQVLERSRKNLSMILTRLASIGQSNVADGLGLHESTVSKMKDGELDRTAKMLALLGLKVVPLEMKCFPQDQIDAIFALAKARMQEMDSAERLSFDD